MPASDDSEERSPDRSAWAPAPRPKSGLGRSSGQNDAFASEPDLWPEMARRAATLRRHLATNRHEPLVRSLAATCTPIIEDVLSLEIVRPIGIEAFPDIAYFERELVHQGHPELGRALEEFRASVLVGDVDKGDRSESTLPEGISPTLGVLIEVRRKMLDWLKG